jgi:hypothetical protein
MTGVTELSEIYTLVPGQESQHNSCPAESQDDPRGSASPAPEHRMGPPEQRTQPFGTVGSSSTRLRWLSAQQCADFGHDGEFPSRLPLGSMSHPSGPSQPEDATLEHAAPGPNCSS